MSARRPGISRSHGRLGWTARHQRVPAVIPSAPVPVSPDPPARIRHVAITPEHPRWYRILRAYRVSDGVDWEVIGECPTALEAMTFARSELGHALVNDWHSKPYYRNAQPIEDRR